MQRKQSNEEKHLKKMRERFENVGNEDSKVISDIFSKNFISSQSSSSNKKIQEQEKLIEMIYKISNEEELTSDLKLKEIMNLIRQSNLKYQ